MRPVNYSAFRLHNARGFLELNTFRDARIRLCLCGLEGRLLAQANAIDPAGTTPHVRGSEMRPMRCDCIARGVTGGLSVCKPLLGGDLMRSPVAQNGLCVQRALPQLAQHIYAAHEHLQQRDLQGSLGRRAFTMVRSRPFCVAASIRTCPTESRCPSSASLPTTRSYPSGESA